MTHGFLLMMRKNFNDSSEVSKCLNFGDINNKNLNRSTSKKELKETSMCEKPMRKQQKDMYLTRYTIDYKTPATNYSSSHEIPNKPKCDCDVCLGNIVHHSTKKHLHPTIGARSKLKPAPLIQKASSKASSYNSLINCVKNLKLSPQMEFKKSIKKQKPKNSSKSSVHSIGSFNKKSYNAHLKDKKPFLKQIDLKLPSKKTKNLSEQSSNSILNENSRGNASKSTTASIQSAFSVVKDHLFDVNKFGKINHDYDIENYFCKNYKNPKETSVEKVEKKSCMLKSSNSTRKERHQNEEKFVLENNELNSASIKKAFLIEDLNSNTLVINHRTRDACQNGTNVCKHISLVCDKCVEKVKLKNFKLYRCDLINEVFQ